MTVKVYEKGKAQKLSKNFNSTEFDCHGKDCCSTTCLDVALIDILQKIRDKFGKAVTINSGYRCPVHNRNIKGASKSKHIEGMAADIVVSGVAPSEVAKFAESIGVLGIGLYPWGCHVDTRTQKSFWYGDKQEYRSTFGGAVEKTFELTFKQLRNGGKGETVKAVQKLLGCSADGVFGAKTEAEVKSFQKANGLCVDGIVGENTMKKLLGV